jgi:sporulation protein YlmC with PRC-barrel domain
MSEISASARVECVDGPCGQCLTLIVDPKTHRVTHLVIEDGTLPCKPYQRLVPMDQVAETSLDLIRLVCSRDDVAHMEPFIQTHYIQKTGLSYSVLQGGQGSPDAPAAGLSYSTYEEEMVPEGEVAIRPDMEVEASDGHAGTVGDLVVDPQTAEVTHFVVREGHLWGKKEVTLPLAAVDHVAGHTVYLKLDKRAIGKYRRQAR